MFVCTDAAPCGMASCGAWQLVGAAAAPQHSRGVRARARGVREARARGPRAFAAPTFRARRGKLRPRPRAPRPLRVCQVVSEVVQGVSDVSRSCRHCRVYQGACVCATVSQGESESATLCCGEVPRTARAGPPKMDAAVVAAALADTAGPPAAFRLNIILRSSQWLPRGIIQMIHGLRAYYTNIQCNPAGPRRPHFPGALG